MYPMNVMETGGRNTSSSNPLGTKLMPHRDDDTMTTQWRRSTVTDIEEAIDLTWKDPFYDGQPDIVAVFDFPDEDQVAAWFWCEALWVIWPMLGFSVMCFLFYWHCVSQGEDNLDVFLYLGIAYFLPGMIYLLISYSENQTCQRAAKEKMQHVAVSTQGVQMNDTSRDVSVHIPFANIQSVDIVNLYLYIHFGKLPRSCPFPVVKLACDRLPSEKTLWSTLICKNNTICYTTKLKKQKDFIRLVTAMKKREKALRGDCFC